MMHYQDENEDKKEEEGCGIHLFRHKRDVHAFFPCTAGDVHGGIWIGGKLATEGAPSRLRDSRDSDRNKNLQIVD